MTHPKITIFYIILGEIAGRRLRAKNVKESVRARVDGLLWRTFLAD